METIGISGGTGFIGTSLATLLDKKGYNVIIFCREVKRIINNSHFAYWDPENEDCDINALSEINIMIHLAGAGIADKRWTAQRKKEIADSRIKGTRFLISQLKQNAPACKTFIAASAIGYYGPDRGDLAPYHEDTEHYSDFLANTCALWEKESLQAKSFARTVIFRFGIVLGKEKGAFPKFYDPVKWGLMPILGSGKQVYSWIHINDLIAMLYFAIAHTGMQGIFNAVSPQPVTNKELMKALAKARGGIKLPVYVPASALQLLLGEMSTEVLKSCTVSADKILGSGFTFQYPGLDSAVSDLATPIN